MTEKSTNAPLNGRIPGVFPLNFVLRSDLCPILISNGPMQKIVVLTGAGISAESGLQTFRGQNGLWEGHAIEEVATPEAFHNNPEMVYRFYNLRRAQLEDPAIEPNPAHLALAHLQKTYGEKFTLVTQNVDNLHEQAGNTKAIHMHGELEKIRCLKTGETFLWREDLDASTPHPKGISSKLRPHLSLIHI